MILLKELKRDGKFCRVTVDIDSDTLCDLNNIVFLASKETSRYDELALSLVNLYEMVHHGRITDFGTYKNAKYFRLHDSWENWGDKADDKEEKT